MAVVLNSNSSKPSSGGTQTTDSTENDICRIVVDQSIEKQIVLDELSAAATGEANTDERALKNMAGREFPVVRVADFVLSPGEITRMEIDMTGRIPELQLSFKSPSTQFRSKSMPKDGDIVSIFAATKSDTMASIRNDYVITSVSSPEARVSGLNVFLTAKLFLPGFEADAIYGHVGSSKELFKETAKRYGLGFATDDDEDTNDKQLWLCYGISPLRFLNETIQHSWKDEMSFYDWWVDQYYNINFINVNQMILSNEDTGDITVAASNMGGAYEVKQDYSQGATVATPKILTNMDTIQKGVMLVSNMNVLNESTEVTFENGVEIISNEFYHNQHMYKTSSSSDMNIKLSNVPAYNPKLADDHILLRGRAKYDPNENPKSDQARANYSYKDIYIKKPWSGISYVMSDGDEDGDDTTQWSGNVNKNYIRAAAHNRINLMELDKLYIELTTSGLCTQIMRGEMVPVLLRMNAKEEALTGGQEQTGIADRFYSGYYYVSGIKYIYDTNSSSKNKEFSTVFTLKRREWPVPVDNKADNN